MEILFRSTVIFFILWGLTRGVGKRELAELTAFELILLVVMGDLIQQGVTQEDMSITGATMAIGTIAFWVMVFGYASFRWKSTRPVLEGLAVVVVRDGKQIDEALLLERITAEEINEAARGHGIDDLARVRLGVLEPDGKLSFILADGEEVEEREEHRGV